MALVMLDLGGRSPEAMSNHRPRQMVTRLLSSLLESGRQNSAYRPVRTYQKPPGHSQGFLFIKNGTMVA